jgi:hypothetical protein
MGNASADVWPPSSSAVRAGAARMVVAAGSRPGMVWLVFLFFFFFFFLFFCFFFFFFFFFFFSSFFSSASLERKEGGDVRKKVSQEFKSVHVVLTRRHTRPSLSCGNPFPKMIRGRRTLAL